MLPGMKSTGKDFKITVGTGQLAPDMEKFASRSVQWVCISSGEFMKGGRGTSSGWPECCCVQRLENVSLIRGLMGLLAVFH